MASCVYGAVYNSKDHTKLPIKLINKLIEKYHTKDLQIVFDNIDSGVDARTYSRIRFIYSYKNSMSDKLKKKINYIFNTNIRVVYYIINN